MNQTRVAPEYAQPVDDSGLGERTYEPTISWSAVFAGGIAAAAFALILLMLGTGLGLTSLSPWSPPSSNTKAFGFAAIVWVCVTSILTSGLGGYLAGRLRVRWVAADVDEIHFRDTAHGFLSWAVATLMTAAVVTSVASGIVKAGAQAVDTAATNGAVVSVMAQRGNAQAAGNAWPLGYFVDSLFRMPDGLSSAGVSPASNETRAEIIRIFLNSAATGDQLSANDTLYLSQLVARHTGLTSQAAQARVLATYENMLHKNAALEAAAKSAADRARKLAIGASLWVFVSMLMGAFSASLMATYGGHTRQS
ncbi:hypothetical protein [Paraburkholderia terrae]|uniref:hypothetical protein n=1 Tax=Paraburkholderia terrae TaxID=311230 RepID=UPI001EE27F24|nr:hypothetical protein [Paraburkholderia terrae]GJH05944.1 hypothetical protein CBA19C8_35325 [Paraburkholderia terrae]